MTDAYSNLMIRMGSVLCAAIDEADGEARKGNFTSKQIDKTLGQLIFVVDKLEQLNKTLVIAKMKGATK